MGPSGGPITKDNTGVEYYGTIFAALESPHEAGVLWTGSDDGLVFLSRDDGKSWKEVTPDSFPESMQVNGIEAHPFEKGGLYLAGTRYRLDDFQPYLYRTTDYGETWERIDGGIDREHFTRVVRADPARPGLIYAGTERGVYLSLDDGRSWRSLQLDLPIVPITDLAVRQGDLVAATQGRGFWILDDLSPLHQLDQEKAAASPRLFKPRTTHRLGGGRREKPRNMGTNPPDGVILYYSLPEALAPEVELRLEILEEDGSLVRAFTRKPAPGEEEEDGEMRLGEDDRLLEAEEGLNRFVWNLRYPGAEPFEGMVIWNRNLAGPRAVPGTYRARLTVGDWSGEKIFELLADPRVSSSQADYRLQFDFLMGVRDRLSEAHQAIRNLRDLKDQLSALERRLKERQLDQEVVEAAAALREELSGVEEALYQTKNESPQDPLNYPIRLNDKMGGLLRLASFGDFRPTESMLAVRDELGQALAAELEKMDRLVKEKLAAFNALARERGVEPVLGP
jgi:hypothetical protein